MTLGEVCQFRGGGTPSKSIERYWRGEIENLYQQKQSALAALKKSLLHQAFSGEL
jgi:hypothetical protein